MENIYTEPNDQDLDEIYKNDVIDTSKCQGSNQWTSWNSVGNPNENNGDDYETLYDHKILFGSGFILNIAVLKYRSINTTVFGYAA